MPVSDPRHAALERFMEQMSVTDKTRTKIFISYSHNDSEWLERLQVHLKPIERQGLVTPWDDTKIQPGANWREEIQAALDTANIAILLISADFLGSDFIADNELPLLLDAAENAGVTILSLILSPSLYGEIESISKYQSVNPPSEPLIDLSKGEQEKYLVELARTILRSVDGAEKKTLEVGSGSKQIFSVTYERNKYFTGRDEILNRIHAGFESGEAVQAITGFGGLGKTQTAVEYAYRHRAEYKTVLWSNAHSREILVSDFASMARSLNLRVKDAKDQNEVVNATKRWFENNEGWLLILDNADDIALAREFIPIRQTGHVLLTSRAQNTMPIATPHAIEIMSPQEGALFLLHRLRKLKKDEPLESAPEVLRNQAEGLSIDLGGLPLALDQAAAFIEEKPSSLEQYRKLFQSEHHELLKRRGKLAPHHYDSVETTFSLAFKMVEEASPAAADLLRVCVFFEADEIPEEIFSEGASELGDNLSAIADNPLHLEDIIGEACRYSLLQRNPDTQTVSVHRLVQTILKGMMNSDTARTWAERAVRAVNRVFPGVDYTTWPLCSRLIDHAQLLASLIDEYDFAFPEAAQLMNHAGCYLYDSAQYALAEPLCQRALDIGEKALGPDHPDVATSLNNLASLYDKQGKYAEAEPLCRRALDIKEKAFGPDHPSVANSLNNLALLYANQGIYAEAEPRLQRSLDIWEKAFSPRHPEVATSLNNLAALYDNQGKYAEAEPLHKRALDIRVKVLGPDHPSVAASLNNLAELYRNQGMYAEAEPLNKRALDILQKVLGPNHPDVANSLNNLAGLYVNQGKYVEAEPLLQRSLDISEKALDSGHPSVANSLNILGSLYYRQGKYTEAEIIYRRALEIREKALGPDHPDVATSLNNLALLYKNQNKYSEAERLYKGALDIWEKAFSPRHPEVATSLNNLAALYDNQGKYSEAEPLYKRALDIQEKVLGPHHPEIATSINNLAALYGSQGKYAEAEPLHKRALDIREKALGPHHPKVAQSLNNLAGLYHNQCKYAEAEPLLQRSLDIWEKAFGPHHPEIATSLNNLAALYNNQGKYAEAEPLHKHALDIQEKVLGPDHLEVANSLHNLAGLYHNQDKYAEAEPLYRRALEIREKALGPDHPEVANSLNNLASLYYSQSKYAEAEPLYLRAMNILENLFGPNHPSTITVSENYAILLSVMREHN